MSKKTKTATKEKRLNEKRARKAAQKARYASYRDAGVNSKRTSRRNSKAGPGLRSRENVNRNRRTTVDVAFTRADGSTGTVMRGGTVSYAVFCRN